MNDVSSLNGVGSSLASSATSQLSMQDLLRVMMTELTFQDPLKPVENKDFMAQIAQFSALDSNRQLNERIESLLKIQSLSQTVGLLGKTIDANTGSGAVTGKVTALQIVSGDPQMTIETPAGTKIAGITLSQIENVR
jgi:flagellar basal-body rod modification protein FlgD